MEYDSGVSMMLPDSIDLIENDFDDEDHEDIVHEQTNQNEIVELIMAAFEGHDEPSDDDDDDDESLNTTDSSHHSSDEQQILNTNNNNNNNSSSTDEQYIQKPNELRHQQTFFPSPTISTSPPLVSRNDLHAFQITNNEEEIPFNTNNHIVHYQNSNRSSSNTPTTVLHYVPTIDITDPMQAQYLNETQNQLNKLRILCSVKDRKASQLQNLCEEFREKYENDTRTLKHQLELSERTKYDWEQRYQLKNTQYEELIETNNQLHRTIKDSELKIQQLEANKTQFEKKFSDTESLIESLHRKINDLHQFESIARSQQDYERILSTTREKHEQEIISFNEKLQHVQMNLQEKTIEVDELRIQLEIANKNTEKSIFERMETINHLNEQLHDCQRKYTDLLTTTSLESLHQTELKQELICITNDKEKFETKCQELESEIRTLREQLMENEEISIKDLSINKSDSLDNSIVDQSIINENILLKERINEYIFKEKQLREINDELIHKVEQYQLKRSDSSSSSSGGSNETVITASVHMEQIRKLTIQIEQLKKDYNDLEDNHNYEKQELQTIIEQLREDVNELDKTKQLYIDICQEKNSIEDILRTKFEHELKIKLDDMHKIFEQENQLIKRNLEELYQEIDRLKIKHEKQIIELNNELDRLRTNDDAKTRLIYTEKEFEQLKHDYYNLNLKQTDLLKICSKFENENENLLNSLEQQKHEKFQLTQKFDNEIKQLNEKQKQELFSLHQQIDQKQQNFEENIQSLELRITNYENIISQYEEYRIKLENNLQKLTQQRDANKMELRLTKEILTNKENDYNQLKLHCDQCEKHLQNHQEQFRQYENTIEDLERQIKHYDFKTHDSSQTQIDIIQEMETEYREKLFSLDAEKCRLEQCLQEANRALDLADSHLEKEIEKIKISLEQEYNRRYERDQKQYQQCTSPSLNHSNNSQQDIEDIKKMYRIEMDRLYRENIELSQHQTKLIDAHQKQMQIMKKDLDDGYINIINEFQHEQIRLQTRYDQLKQQLNDAQQTIEQLKLNLNQIKINHSEEILKIQENSNNEKYLFEQENRTRQEHLQHRLENLVKLLEQSNDALNQERTIRTQQENEYQQTINSLQKKMTDTIKQHTKAMNDLKQEYLTNQKRPISVPEFTSNDVSSRDIKSDYLTTVEKLRELFTNEMIALLQLTCKMIFDVHHRVTIAQCMDNLDISMKQQIQNELIQSRNSMIKEIRQEIFDKMTYALKSQGVPDISIDMHIFELDHLLSQMVQDCLNSLPTVVVSSSSSLNSPTVLSLQTTPQRPISSNSSSIPRKSIECLYMTPIVNKKPAPLAPHCHSTLDLNRRPKSASNIFLANQNPISTSSSSSSHAHKFQRSPNKNTHIKMHRSEDDIVFAMKYNQEQKLNTLTFCEDDHQIESEQMNNIQILIKQSEQTSDKYYATTRIINHKKQDDDEEELTWPQQPIPTTQSNGIKKFVRNSLRLFINQPQQHKRTGN